MSSDPVVVLGDAHLGFAPPETAAALHTFLRRAPDLASHLVINGDLFEFWYAYRHVIPRQAFPTLAVLTGLVQRGIRITVIGGNHDRWGGDFWTKEVGAEYASRSLYLELAGFQTLLRHGDGMTDPQRTARILQRMVHHPLTEWLFRWIHPDMGLPLVTRVARRFPGKWTDTDVRRRSAAAQATYARHLLRERSDVDLLILGHTHEAVLEEVGQRRWYLNPGAWMDGCRYALITGEGPQLRRWG